MRQTIRLGFRPARAPLVVALAAALWAAPARAQVFEAAGARALGMGGAFIAVADDGTAAYWNPAGLGWGVVLDFSAGYGRLADWTGGGKPVAGQDAGVASLCLALPVIAFSYNRLDVAAATGTDNSTAGGSGSRQDLRPQGVGVSSLTTAHYGLTLVQTVVPGVVVGATLKLVRGDAATGEAPAGTAKALVTAAGRLGGKAGAAFDADIGVMAGGGPIRVGLTVRNVREPAFETPDGGRLALARQVRAGVAWTPGGRGATSASGPRGSVVAVDVDLTRTAGPGGRRRMVAAGVERWWRGRRVGVRAGGRASTVGAARPVAAAGVSVGVRPGVFLEAAGTRGHRDGDRGWFVAIRAGL